MTSMHSIERCAGCGLEVHGGAAGCQTLFDELLARDFGDVRFGRLHRMMVDIYSLQHPDRYCASAKSFAAHLTGLCWLIEHPETSRATGNDALRAWLDGVPELSRPTPPESRGALTIAHVHAQVDAAAYARAVEEWASSTWAAYAPLHERARQWIERAYRRPARPARSRRGD